MYGYTTATINTFLFLVALLWVDFFIVQYITLLAVFFTLNNVMQLYFFLYPCIVVPSPCLVWLTYIRCVMTGKGISTRMSNNTLQTILCTWWRCLILFTDKSYLVVRSAGGDGWRVFLKFGWR